jgi:phosphoenolpyruvate carboxykinase (GTP)
LTAEGDVWWEGLTEEPPDGLVSWRGAPWTPELEEPAAHPDGRFAVALSRYAMKDEHWDDPDGVPLDAILVGGRRSNTMPLVMRSFSWRHGVMLAATLGSEVLRFEGEFGKLGRDPFAMSRYCGSDLGAYVEDFLALERKVPEASHLPVIFGVNWFLIGSAFRPLWPGYAENLRVLKWIFENLDGSENSADCPIGKLPQAGSLDLRGLELSALAQHELVSVDSDDLRSEAWLINEVLQNLGDRVPPALEAEVEALGERLLMGFMESTAHRPGTQMAANEVLGTSPHQAVGIPSR